MENQAETYEEKRAKRLAENAKVLQSLQLEPLAPVAKPKAGKTQAAPRKRKAPEEAEEPEPRRISLRRLKLDPDGLEAKEAREKEEAKRAEEEIKAARVQGPFALGSAFLHADDGDLDAFSKVVADAADTSSTLIASKMPQPPDLTMRDDHRLRATKDRIYSLVLHPHTSSDRVLAIAGDKQGEVAFAWTPCFPENSQQDIFTFKIHKRPVTGLELAANAPQWMFTSSYEGSIRRMDLKSLVCDELYGQDNDLITTLTVDGSGHLVYFANTEGEMSLIDTRAANKPVVRYAPLSERKISGIQLNPLDSNFIAMSSLARNVAIFDVRNLPSGNSKKDSKPISIWDHGKSASSIYWSPDATKLVSTSFDDTLALFDWKNSAMHFAKSIRHNNQTGRWVTNFKAKFLAQSDAIVVGNMKQTLDLYDAHKGHCLANCRSDLVTAIPAVVGPSPTLPYGKKAAFHHLAGNFLTWRCLQSSPRVMPRAGLKSGRKHDGNFDLDFISCFVSQVQGRQLHFG